MSRYRIVIMMMATLSLEVNGFVGKTIHFALKSNNENVLQRCDFESFGTTDVRL